MDAFIEQLASRSWPEWLGMFTGVVGVWLSIKEKIGAWPFFILCYSSYVYIGYSESWFAFMGMNAVFVGLSCYGWFKWSQTASQNDTEVHISKLPSVHWLKIGLFLLLGTASIGFLVDSLDGAKLPYLDAFATCCGFTAQWLLSRKHVETWLFWIVMDAIYLCMFVSDQAWPTVLLFAIFIVLAVKGWREWQQQLH